VWGADDKLSPAANADKFNAAATLDVVKGRFDW
jgi:hypothetical protein